MATLTTLKHDKGGPWCLLVGIIRAYLESIYSRTSGFLCYHKHIVHGILEARVQTHRNVFFFSMYGVLAKVDSCQASWSKGIIYSLSKLLFMRKEYRC